jgi:hypothetical protein
MTNEKKASAQRKPTGQEMDQQYDVLHEELDADTYSTPQQQRQEKQQELEAYAEDLKDPD